MDYYYYYYYYDDDDDVIFSPHYFKYINLFILYLFSKFFFNLLFQPDATLVY